ncbi:MIP/aquaporin family protein [Acaryochloris marina]|uniref:MIP/aquaporin family protein n=1 Tax=Acaryochloris marina TaxID=155978 RepID=UPI0021C3C5EC|nr:aquaporin [Acaryochloris marina]BDM83297.1 hypothetical protein AM10699_61580 [Acaryochloris marina MBIC10699]
MISAGLFATLLYAPDSPAFHWIPEWLRGLLMGIAMGVTAIAIIYSPGGKHSGAHINPAVTLTFYRLHKIQARDALAYIVAQFIGGLTGVWFIAALLGRVFTDAPVNYVITVPGLGGEALAFLIEFLLSFVLMLMILFTSNTRAFSKLTGIFAGILLSFYIPLAAPISGMSINPARTFASALPAQMWMGLWLYFVAPPAAMLLAAEIYLWSTQRTTREICCKLCPNVETPCISHRCCQVEEKTIGKTDL